MCEMTAVRYFSTVIFPCPNPPSRSVAEAAYLRLLLRIVWQNNMSVHKFVGTGKTTLIMRFMALRLLPLRHDIILHCFRLQKTLMCMFSRKLATLLINCKT